jgi:hypothetical protein
MNSGLIMRFARYKSLLVAINHLAPRFIPDPDSIAMHDEAHQIEVKKPAARGACGGEAEVLKQNRVLNLLLVLACQPLAIPYSLAVFPRILGCGD